MATSLYSDIDNIYNHNVGWKKPDPKEKILFDSVSMKFIKKQN